MNNAMLLTDGYKLDHRRQYPEGTECVYANWTPRSSEHLHEAKDGCVVFGIQYFIKKYLIGTFNKGFFALDEEAAVKSFKRRIDTFLGENSVGTEHIRALHRLEAKGFAATNLVLGIGSYTYQYRTRDSLGFAMKATWCQVNGEPREIFKSPKTDSGMKKSLKGLIRVDKDENGIYHATDCVSREQEAGGCLKTVFEDGKLMNEVSMTEIRERLCR